MVEESKPNVDAVAESVMKLTLAYIDAREAGHVEEFKKALGTFLFTYRDELGLAAVQLETLNRLKQLS
jgi:hypothetical protein